MSTRRETIAEALRVIAPRTPAFERDAILDHAQDSTGLKTASPQTAAWLSLVAYIRHTLTEYDDLLADGYDMDSARHFVLDQINEVLADWGCRRQVDGDAEED